MIDLRELDETIDYLKRNGSTRKEAEHLALLYIARDHLIEDSNGAEQNPEPAYSRAAEPTIIVAQERDEPASAFCEAAESAPFQLLLDVLDEHMESIRIMWPKEYDHVVRKLTEY